MLLSVVQYFLKIFELKCSKLSLISTVGNISEADCFVAECFSIENLEICKTSLSWEFLDSLKLKLEQITITRRQQKIILTERQFLIPKPSALIEIRVVINLI